MVSDMMAVSPAPRVFGEYLAQQSEGNPFFVSEYLRAAVEERSCAGRGGAVQVAESGDSVATVADYEQLPLPGTLRDLAGRRLEGMPIAAKRVAEIAAVLGGEIEVSLLGQAAGIEETALFEGLGELFRRRVLEEGYAGSVRYAHERIREIAYERIGADDRVALHRAAAVALEGLGGWEQEAALAAIGATGSWRATRAWRAATTCVPHAGPRASM